jgi:hypothetical protein
MSDPIKGERLLTDGITRPVLAARDGREYVIDGDGQKVFGLWLVPMPECSPHFRLLARRNSSMALANSGLVRVVI